MTDKPNGDATAKRVSEADLNRLQEDLNRANHKLSIAIGHDIRSAAIAVEANQAKLACAKEVARLQAAFVALTQQFHADRAAEFGIGNADYISPALSENLRRKMQENDGQIPVEQIVGTITADKVVTELNKPKAVWPVAAVDATPKATEDNRVLLASARNFQDLTGEEMDDARLLEPAEGDTHSTYKLPSGELIVGGPLEG
jgi:hypothetical protein